ncbi:MAG: sensor histidine kinase [Acidimicrobiia bacterium]
MANLTEILRTHTALEADALAHLQRLVGGWSLLADFSFTDLLLFVPVAADSKERFVIAAQVRPSTGQTTYMRDLIGTVVEPAERPLLVETWRRKEICVRDTKMLGGEESLRVECIPVRHNGEMLALVTRESSVLAGRRPGELERTYLEVFDRFARMVTEGSYPFAINEVEPEDAPRVGDGVIVLDPAKRIRFASPNAVSSLHRLGIHAYASGITLTEVGFEDTAVDMAVRSQTPVTAEIERGEVAVLARAIPLFSERRSTGCVLMLRNVTDLRRRDRLLLSKDATIREVHHRVKNNLQTIAALLRLQERRTKSEEAQQALRDSEQRIRSIAIVHETLAREANDFVEFNAIVRPLVRLVEETVSSDERPVRFEIEGDAGDLPGEVATPLAVVLNELMQNAVDHAFAPSALEATITISFTRTSTALDVFVGDNGVGLPADFSLEDASGLGLSIVRVLVTGELAGTLRVESSGGTRWHVHVPVRVGPLP